MTLPNLIIGRGFGARGDKSWTTAIPPHSPDICPLMTTAPSSPTVLTPLCLDTKDSRPLYLTLILCITVFNLVTLRCYLGQRFIHISHLCSQSYFLSRKGAPSSPSRWKTVIRIISWIILGVGAIN